MLPLSVHKKISKITYPYVRDHKIDWAATQKHMDDGHKLIEAFKTRKK